MTALEGMTAAMEEMERVDTSDAEAEAIGVWTDDPKNPGIVAAYYRGTLYGPVVPQRYANALPKRDLDTLVAAVVLNARIAYAKDIARIRKQATRV